MARLHIAIGSGFFALILTAGLLHRPTSAATVRGWPALRQTTVSTFAPGHLYVAQGADIASKVYRFPLQSNGLPSTKPDGELSLGFRYPGSIAIGPDGDLYVSSSGDANACKNQSKCFVEVFAPGASGKAAPLRVLYVPQQPQYVAVDERGYLDVSVLQGGGEFTYVYKPNASGNEQPINQINIGAQAVAAAHGTVYIQTIDSGIAAARERSPSQPVYFDDTNPGGNGVATDATQLYDTFDSYRGNRIYLSIAVYRLDRPGGPIRTIVGTGCNGKGGTASTPAVGYGLAVYKQYAFEGCVGPGGAAGVVFVYDTSKGGKQAPIMQLPGGDSGVAIGP